MIDTNSIATIQQLIAEHPEIEPVYQRHAPAIGIAIAFLVREWQHLGGLSAIQAYCDSRTGGLVVSTFRWLFGSPKTTQIKP